MSFLPRSATSDTRVGDRGSGRPPGLVGLAAILALAFLVSHNRGRIQWRTVVVGLAIQVAFAALVLRWSVGRDVPDFVAGQVTALIEYTDDGIEFLFGSLVADEQSRGTVLNEFVAYADFGPDIENLSEQTVVLTTFALAGFANLASIAIQIGSIGSLAPERRGEVAGLGLRALLAGSLVNLANAAIAGVVAA